MNVILYVRVSTEEQSRSGLSLETQEKALKEYCERNNHTIIDIYRDAGFSARKPYNKRPEMMRLINDLEDRKPQKILFTKLDAPYALFRVFSNATPLNLTSAVSRTIRSELLTL